MQDLCSYNIEQSRGDDSHNIITIVMHHFGMNLTDALLWLEKHHHRLEFDFMTQYNELKSIIGDTEANVLRYADGLGNWVRANDCWSFESQRYFGTQGKIIQFDRRVWLLPLPR